jgi:hypothetical protein
LRHPTKSLVTGLPSAVMYRAVPRSANMAVLGATSAPHHQTLGLDHRAVGLRQCDAGF